MGRFDSMFVDDAAPMLMDFHGISSAIHRNITQQQTSAVGTALLWCVLNPEVRRFRQREYGMEVYYERHGWVITDAESDYYCGVPDIQMGDKLVDGDREYNIDECRKRESSNVVDFRCTRVDWVETRKSDLRGR